MIPRSESDATEAMSDYSDADSDESSGVTVTKKLLRPQDIRKLKYAVHHMEDWAFDQFVEQNLQDKPVNQRLLNRLRRQAWREYREKEWHDKLNTKRDAIVNVLLERFPKGGTRDYPSLDVTRDMESSMDDYERLQKRQYWWNVGLVVLGLAFVVLVIVLLHEEIQDKHNTIEHGPHGPPPDTEPGPRSPSEIPVPDGGTPTVHPEQKKEEPLLLPAPAIKIYTPKEPDTPPPAEGDKEQKAEWIEYTAKAMGCPPQNLYSIALEPPKCQVRPWWRLGKPPAQVLKDNIPEEARDIEKEKEEEESKPQPVPAPPLSPDAPSPGALPVVIKPQEKIYVSDQLGNRCEAFNFYVAYGQNKAKCHAQTWTQHSEAVRQNMTGLEFGVNVLGEVLFPVRNAAKKVERKAAEAVNATTQTIKDAADTVWSTAERSGTVIKDGVGALGGWTKWGYDWLYWIFEWGGLAALLYAVGPSNIIYLVSVLLTFLFFVFTELFLREEKQDDDTKDLLLLMALLQSNKDSTPPPPPPPPVIIHTPPPPPVAPQPQQPPYDPENRASMQPYAPNMFTRPYFSSFGYPTYHQ